MNETLLFFVRFDILTDDADLVLDFLNRLLALGECVLVNFVIMKIEFVIFSDSFVAIIGQL